ncbi:MAG: hypothetical protein L6U99_12820 [Clostridium sp.]|nr:MAG: hypothetical protein L6U99_12820 [Clostridium sp.]
MFQWDFLLGASLYGCTNKETLVLYNWGEYIDNSNMDGVNLIKKFEREYNCKVKKLLTLIQMRQQLLQWKQKAMISLFQVSMPLSN